MPPDKSLTPDRLAQLQALFEEALAGSAEEVDALVVRLRASDTVLADQLVRLLEAHARTGRALDRTALVRQLGDAPSDADPWIGARVGVYEVQRQIGYGGMGAVYEAVRADDEYQMRVAIKFLRHHAAGELALRRFRAERQILASLSHRNIAGLLDGGVTDDGQPYFVMEFIEGEPITTWCDNRRLPVAERLTLFRQVCGAVQYAHQSLVIHRDLKPGNILVTQDGTVKLLDFGIAKLLPTPEEQHSGEFPITQAGLRAYTPEYASPEQVLGEPVSTRSDVYALGVVLFELLTGDRPFTATGRALLEVEQLVTLADPPRPSTRIRPERTALLGERSHPKAQGRVAGDLDAIVLQALRKEPERRYGSAADFSEDVHRHLRGLPVLARPDSLGYRTGRLVRRHRAATAALTLAVVSLVTGTVISVGQARAAEAERVRATEVTSFLTTMLGAASPSAFGREVQVREVLDSASVRARDLADQPVLEAEIRSIIGGTYVALGEFELAEAEYRIVLARHELASPRGSRATGFALTRLSSALEFQGRYAEADSVLGRAGEVFERHAPEEVATSDFYELRARLAIRLDRLEEAVALLRTALQIEQRQVPVNDSSISTVYGNLGVVLSDLGRHLEAESVLVAGVAAARRAHGEVHPTVAALLSPLATVQEYAGKPAEADSTYRATIAMRRELLGPEHPDLAWTMFNYADHLVRVGRYAEGAEWARRVLELRGRSLDDAHPAVSTAMAVLGRALGPLGELSEAERWLRESWQLRQAHFPAGHWLIDNSEGVLGEHLILQGRYQEAETHLLRSEQALVAARGAESESVRDARNRLVKLYETWGRPAQVAEWRASMARSGGG
ncbi:MAG: tetratricopeptide repeat protein [Gemmatimonadales bacterium]